MGVNKLVVFAVVFHTGTNAAPHRFVWSRINPVMTRSCRGEIDISTMFGMLGGKDVIVNSTFVIISIFCRRVNPEQVLRQLEHIVRIARFRPIVDIDKIDTRFFGWEMLPSAVSSESQ